MEILHIPRKGMNRAAFSEGLMCPRIAGSGVCGGTKFQFVEAVSQFMHRYRCKKCGRTLKYEFSNNPDYMNTLYGRDTKSIMQKIRMKFLKHIPRG